MPASLDVLLLSDPIQQFKRWFEQAKRDPALDLPEAMCLSTLSRRGFPTARMILLKECERRGFTFFTNVHSPKAKEMRLRPRAALTFHWRSQRRQIRIEGTVSLLPKRESDAYFATRPRLSQIGSWASRQSEPLASRVALLEHFDDLVTKFQGKQVPAPPYWQGFCVKPERLEFWQERPNRLHDRWLYVRNRKGRWTLSRLYP